MSVCVVAQFPWSTIRSVTTNEPPGVIVCSDTRIVAGKKVIPWLCSKQEPIGKNILVCYTSSNAAATSFGLKRVRHDSNVKRIGISLKQAHERYGGITEAIAVVWRRHQTPQILELMPPRYIPRPRQGIIGIGDREVLHWFCDNFVADPPEDLVTPPPPALLEAIAQAMGHPFVLPPARFPIKQAALQVAAAFTEGIRLAGGPTVSLPVQVMTISDGQVRGHGISASADLENWESLTAEREEVRVVRPNPPTLKKREQDEVPRKAMQLFI